ncbi:MAG: LytTR family DNA-binding domain-containing protein [Chitinophagaceae bacterium]
MMITGIIVDDELNNVEHLQRLLQQHFPQIRVVATADNVTAAYTAIVQYRPDLVFLDIQMPGESGFDLLTKFTHIDFEVIFVTAHDQYGIQAIKFSALDYLLKPVTVNDLQVAVEKASTRITKKQKDHSLENLLSFITTGNKEQQKIALPLQDEIRYAPVGSIIRCEASNNYAYVLLDSGEKLLVCKTLKEFAGLLKPYGFVRTHQSHLVNTRFVKSYLKEDGGILLLTDKTKIPVSKAHRIDVKEALQQIF